MHILFINHNKNTFISLISFFILKDLRIWLNHKSELLIHIFIFFQVLELIKHKYTFLHIM